jgi:NadR type nicotinamide-nucleotide adenylyltransferase
MRELGLRYDVVCSSESYGPPFAAAMEADHLEVDGGRRRAPVSGTAVRGDLRRWWHLLHPVVRAGLTRRIVVVGAESTGTTTLARDLAEHLGTPSVGEYGRTLSEHLAGRAGSIEAVRWTASHFDAVVLEQLAAEQDTLAAHVADAERSRPHSELGPLVICDTDLLATAVWRERYTGTDPAPLLGLVAAHAPLGYVLTSPHGVAFEQDGLRDGEHLRAEMHDRFVELLDDQAAPWTIATGDRPARVAGIVAWIHDTVARTPMFATGADP